MEYRQVIFLLIFICSAYQHMLVDGVYKHMVGQNALINLIFNTFMKVEEGWC